MASYLELITNKSIIKDILQYCGRCEDIIYHPIVQYMHNTNPKLLDNVAQKYKFYESDCYEDIMDHLMDHLYIYKLFTNERNDNTLFQVYIVLSSFGDTYLMECVCNYLYYLMYGGKFNSMVLEYEYDVSMLLDIIIYFGDVSDIDKFLVDFNNNGLLRPLYIKLNCCEPTSKSADIYYKILTNKTFVDYISDSRYKRLHFDIDTETPLFLDSISYYACEAAIKFNHVKLFTLVYNHISHINILTWYSRPRPMIKEFTEKIDEYDRLGIE